MRIMRLLMAATLSFGAALMGAAGAHADTLPINCNAHVLDATTSGGVDTAFIQKKIDSLRAVSPTADIYIQAYQNLPGGGAGQFWQAGLQQCANWRSASGNRAADNVLVAAYGVDSGELALYYGKDFALAMSTYEEEIRSTVLIELANLNGQPGDLDYVTSGLVQVLMNAEFYIKNSQYYSEVDGIYYPPVTSVPVVDEFRFEPTEFIKASGLGLLLIVGFGLLVVVLSPAAKHLSRFVPPELKVGRPM